MAKRAKTASRAPRPVTVSVEPFGDKQVSRDILRIGARGRNFRPLWPLLATYFYAMEEQQFSSEGAFASGGWPALKDTTLARKRAKGQNLAILRADDILYRSLTSPTARYSKRIMRGTEMFVGSVDPVGVHHQHGAPAAHVPMRKPVEFREEDKVAWVKMMQRYLITGDLPMVPGV